MKVVWGHPLTIGGFVASQLGHSRPFENFTAMGVVDDDGVLVGGVVFHNWDPENGVIELSAASTTPRWLTRDALHGMFSYPFDQLECQLVVLRVSDKNVKLGRMLLRFGFSRFFIPRLRGRHEGEFVYTLTEEAWRNTPLERKLNGKVPAPADAPEGDCGSADGHEHWHRRCAGTA